MKVTEPIDVYIADKLFQLTATTARRRAPRTSTARRSTARPWSSSAAATASARDIADARRQAYGATVITFSRSATNTHVERREDIVAACARGARRRPAGSTSSSTPPACCPAASWPRRPRRPIYAATEINYLAPILIAQEFHPHLRRRSGRCCFHLQLLHPRPQRLQPLLLGQGGHRQPDPGAGRRVGRRRRAGQLRQPRAHRHPDAHQGVRRGAGGHAARLEAVARASLDVLIST